LSADKPTEGAPVQSWLSDNLSRLIEKHSVPAASVAVLVDGQVVTEAAGVLNLKTGIEATTDSVFQIGSVTKLWTSTLAMQLVQEGKLDLDQPVRDYLPEFKLADGRAAAVVTTRQLLTHTSGFSGDAFTATSRGDDAVELFVSEVLPTLAQELQPGTGFSYNNSGFVVLGRLLEVLRGKPFHELVKEYIGTPLGLQHLATIPEEALLHRAALGHISPEPGAPLEAAARWNLPHAMGPAGALLAMSARDLITFGKACLDHELLDQAMIEQMWEPQVDLPTLDGFPSQWGLGWMIFGNLEGGPIYGHDGGTIGQSAYFRLAPAQGVAIALLTNGGNGPALYDELVGHVLRETAGVELPGRSVPPEQPLPIPEQLVVGRYEDVRLTVEVSVGESGEAWVEVGARTPEAKELLPEPRRTRLVALDETRLIAAERERGVHEVVVFVQPDGDGRAGYLFSGGRLTPRAHRR
jgi:CubicO group peptidase (beta-lactamase class C family)